jgi:peptide/nickel transport system substrate-binding protein
MTTDSSYWKRIGARRLGRRRTLTVLAGGAGAAAFLAACGGGDDGDSRDAAGSQPGAIGADEQPVPGGIISQAIPTDPPNLDLHQVTTYTGVWPIAPAFNQLVQFDPAKPGDTPQDIIPDLAESYEQPDPTTVVFKLKRGVKFHDGSDFTSQDVKTQLDWIKKPPQGKTSPRAGAQATVDSIEMTDPHTVTIKLSRPTASYIMNLASHYFAIGQAKDIEANGGTGPTLMGTGPFKLKSYQRSNFLELEKNPNYHVQGRPYLDGLKFFIIPDFTTRLTNFLAGQYQLIYGNVERSDQQRMRDELGNKVVTPEVPSYTRDYAFPNARREPYNDLRVRQAINLAIDRDAAIQVVRQGAAYRGAYMSPKGIWALPEAELRSYDGYDKPNIEKAKQLLAAAGVQTPLQASATTRTDFQNMAEFVKDQLAKIGIVVNLTLADTATAQPVLQRSDFDIGPWTISINIDDPDATFSEISTSNAVRNWSGVKDPMIDALYDRQSQTLNVEERKKLVNDMEKQALSQNQVACLYFHLLTFGRYTSVRNFVEHESLYTNRRMESVWLKT